VFCVLDMHTKSILWQLQLSISATHLVLEGSVFVVRNIVGVLTAQACKLCLWYARSEYHKCAGLAIFAKIKELNDQWL